MRGIFDMLSEMVNNAIVHCTFSTTACYFLKIYYNVQYMCSVHPKMYHVTEVWNFYAYMYCIVVYLNTLLNTSELFTHLLTFSRMSAFYVLRNAPFENTYTHIGILFIEQWGLTLIEIDRCFQRCTVRAAFL